jgi:predicted metalloprotease with PDZ domain
MRFPKEIKFGRWAAETRGANLIVFSGDMPFKTQSLQRLHEQLRHELFHLWMPNNLALTGNYDWFYEGFTVYQALRTGISMNQIRFEDFLDTLAQAYNLDNLPSERKSLVESSRTRWNGENNQIYARGMLTAFLCDIALLNESKGKRSISTIFREIYQKHRFPNQPEDGNAAILKILKNYSELDPVIEKYIAGTQKIKWETALDAPASKRLKKITSSVLKSKPS